MLTIVYTCTHVQVTHTHTHTHTHVHTHMPQIITYTFPVITISLSAFSTGLDHTMMVPLSSELASRLPPSVQRSHMGAVCPCSCRTKTTPPSAPTLYTFMGPSEVPAYLKGYVMGV